MANSNGTELCMIGKDKNETELKLFEEAKKKFKSVFYVSMGGIRLGLDDDFSLVYRSTDLFKFNAIFPWIPRRLYSYGYQLLSLFPPETYMPIRPISFLLNEERFFLLTVLRKREIPTINMRLARSSEAAERVVENAKFPIIIRTPDKKTGVIVKNKIEAKSIIDALVSLHQHVLIEDVASDVVSVYVSDPDVIAAGKKKTKEKDVVFAKGELKSVKIDIETRQLAIDTAKAIEAQICRVDITTNGKNPKVVNVDLAPSLIKASKALGENLPKKIIEHTFNSFEEYKQRPMLVKFFNDAKSVMKDVLKTKQLL